ncbi:hypothetical protein BBJ28_00019872 [Nothophytophthora sp. Chile5]|nr:hypothetical protein BBJ28_00019872 [Nothophytophthora sp. Chile5]
MKHDTSPLFTKSFQVHSLRSDSYESMLNDTGTVWLVDYYAPWCPHCRHFAPEWEKVASFYAGTDRVQVGAVDCTKNNDICSRENIYGYPGVKIHHVPAGAEKAIKMAKGAKNTKIVIAWTERVLEEHGMTSGVSADDINAQIKQLRSEHVAGAASKGSEPSYNDQSMELKYKRLHDAGVAVVSTFENGFFLGTTVLQGERYDMALMWVEALAASFPMEGNRAALATLAGAMRENKRWDQTDWNVLIKKWKTISKKTSFPTNLFESSEDEGWAVCKTYTCGLWTLFHSITVSESSTSSATESWKASKIMAAIRLYVKYFFGCEECREHFLASNPETLIEELATKDAEGSHAVALWIWKMHNTVNKVVSKEQWPSKRACPVCYVEDGEPLSLDSTRLHEDEIVAYVTSAYGHDNDEIFALNAAHNGMQMSCTVIYRNGRMDRAIMTGTFALRHLPTVTSGEEGRRSSRPAC